MNPLLKEIHYDRMIKQMTDEEMRKLAKLERMERLHCGCKGQASAANFSNVPCQNSWMNCPPTERIGMAHMQLEENAIPTTFLPPQVSAPVPPPSFEETASHVGPFNPFCQPLYPPGCPTPGCPGSYPGFQPPSNVPPTMCYQQEFHMNCPTYSAAANPSSVRFRSRQQ